MSARPAWQRPGVFQACLILFLGGMAYWPTVHGLPLWDDATEIFHNPDVTGGAGGWHAWIHPWGPDYLPLKTTVNWLLYHLGAGRVEPFHVTSILLHLTSAFLLWAVLDRLTVRAAWFGALLFAVHPVAVESVAWMAELKNTLSLPLLLLALLVYLEPDRPGRPPRTALALVLFAAALLCKAAGIAFPIFLLLVGWARERRCTTRSVKRTIPFFGLSLIVGLVTVYFQESRALMAGFGPTLPFTVRLLRSGGVLAWYGEHLFVPANLMPIYPDLPPLLAGGLGLFVWAALLGFIGWSLTRAQETVRFAGLGVAALVLSLVPVLGILPMSFLRIAPLSDHLAYFACPAVAGLLAGGAGLMISRVAWPSFWSRVAVIAVIPATFSTQLARTYRDPITFWTVATEKNPGSWFAQNDLGSALLAAHRPADALPHLEAARLLAPHSSEVQANLSNAQLLVGNMPAALTAGEAAVSLDPEFSTAHYNWANALAASDRAEAALREYRLATAEEPDAPDIWYNLGVAAATANHLPEAVQAFERAVRLAPDRPEAHLNLGNVLAATGDPGRAEAEFRRAARLQPGSAEPLACLADILAEQGRYAEALPQYQAALALKPHDPELEAGMRSAQAHTGH